MLATFLSVGILLTVGSGASAASATLSGAATENVVAGLDSTTQTVRISGRSAANGGTDAYELNLTEIVAAGGEIGRVTFENVGSDDDTVGRAPTYDSGTNTVSLPVTEDATDADRQIDFAVRVELATADVLPESDVRYGVRQYETSSVDVARHRQTVQFDVVGSATLAATTTRRAAEASPVIHRAKIVSPERVRDVTSLTVDVSGANYAGVTAASVTVRRNGGSDLVTVTPPTVRDDGRLSIRLDSPTTLRESDELEVVVANATNPASTTGLTVSFRLESGTPVFAATDAIEVQSAADATCELSQSSPRDSRRRSTGNRRLTAVETPSPSPFQFPSLPEVPGVEFLGMVAALVTTAVLASGGQ